MVFNTENKYDFDRVVRFIVAVGLVAGLVWLLSYLSDVLIPFAGALLLAYLINPLVTWSETKVKNKTIAVFFSLFVVFTTLALVLMLVVPMVTTEIRHTGRLINDSGLFQRAAAKLPPELSATIKELTTAEEIKNFFKNDDSLKLASAAAQKVMPGIFGFISGATGFVTGLLGLSIVILYVIFLLFDFQKVKTGWQDLIPVPYREPVTAFANDFSDAMQRYFRAQAAVAAIVGVLFAIGFSLIGLPLGILVGLFIGLLNMVPYLQVIGLIPAGLLAVVHALEMGDGVWMTLGLTGLVFIVVQLIQDAVLVPKIMGKVTGMSPAIILLSLSVWGKLLGMLGLLIALPMTCLLWAYYQRLLESAARNHEKARHT